MIIYDRVFKNITYKKMSFTLDYLTSCSTSTLLISILISMKEWDIFLIFEIFFSRLCQGLLVGYCCLSRIVRSSQVFGVIEVSMVFILVFYDCFFIFLILILPTIFSFLFVSLLSPFHLCSFILLWNWC